MYRYYFKWEQQHTKLVCPDDYDKDKFSKILKLFDKLDKNGDRVVETSELKEISELHVKNRIRLLKQSKVTAAENLKLKISSTKYKKLQMKMSINK